MIRTLLAKWKDGPLVAAVVLVAGLTLAFAPDPYPMMIARSFLWQWVMLSALIAMVALITRRWWSAAAALASAALMACSPVRTVQPMMVTEGPAILRVAQMNVLQPNDAHAEVIAAALATDADVLSFQEVSPTWAAALVRGLAGRYPYRHLVPRSNCYGLALFSKHPFVEDDVVMLSRTPMLSVVVGTAQGAVRLMSVHATSPGSYGHFRRRNAQLRELAPLVRNSRQPVVVLGDLNTVPWDGAMVGLCSRTGLREHSDGTSATWPAFGGMALIPLDHILVSKDLAVSGLSRFPVPGSDHRGLVADILVRT